jgi:hypothetical protein
MPIDRSCVAENDAERKRLRALVQRLSDRDLAHPMDAGWTVAGVLAHVALWDQRIVVLLDEWERRGSSWTPPVESAGDVDWINDAAKPLCLALPPRIAAELAVSVAKTVDRRVAAVSDAIIEASARAPVLNWRRSVHRREHLDQIERALGRARLPSTRRGACQRAARGRPGQRSRSTTRGVKGAPGAPVRGRV